MGYKGRYRNARNNYGRGYDSEVAGVFGNSGNNGNGVFDTDNGFEVAGAFENGDTGTERTEYEPTETIVNNRTINHTIRRIHPTHIVNVNRNVYRVENYYPTTESVENVNYVQEYNCGNDLRNPCCKPIKKKCKCQKNRH